MRLLLLTLAFSQLCSAIPHITPDASSLEPRFVNLLTNDEKSTLQKQTATSQAGSKSPPLLPTYPSPVTNPVDPNSWLMQYARSSKVTPFWNFTETLYHPCQRHRQPLPTSCTHPPTCEDVHSLTHLNLFTNCEHWLYAPICTFATFVLPDSQCPGRINSYTLRCPQNADQFNAITYYDAKYGYHAKLSNLANAINDVSIATPEQCSQGIVRGRQPNGSYLSWKRSSLVVREPGPLLQLTKRTYIYRSYLNSKNLYRSYAIEGPRDPLPDAPTNKIDRIKQPWTCYVPEEMSQAEKIYLNGTQVEICWYPAGTGDAPDERCPGMRSGNECPRDDDELVDAILGYCKTRCRKWSTEEQVRELVEREMKRVEPPCRLDDRFADMYCVGPSGEGK